MRWLPLLALAGCSLFNRFEATPPTDAGPRADAGMIDAGTRDSGPPEDGGPDAGVDGGMPDGGPRRELNCTNGDDDDHDGFVDCEDFDCNDAFECCGDEDPAEEPLGFGGDIGDNGWKGRPTGGFMVPQRSDHEDETDAWLEEFRGSNPNAIVSEVCQSLALGARYELEWRFDSAGGAEGCTGDSGPCAEFKAFKLTPVDDMEVGNRLFDDFSLRVHPTGYLEVSTGNTPVGPGHELDVGIGSTITTQIDVRPGIDSKGMDPEPALEITVTVITDVETEIYRDTPILLDNLVATDDEACGEVPGLFVAIEGTGGGVSVRGEERTPLECLNPNQFEAPTSADEALVSGPLDDGVSLGFEPELPEAGFEVWADEGLLAPAFLYVSEPANRWHVLATTSNDQPELERTVRVGYAIGHARAPEASWSNWETVPPDDAPSPRLGDQPPSCVGDTCSTVSVREPHALTRGGDDLYVVYAAETDAATRTYALRFALVPRDVSAAISVDQELWTDDACESVRDPALVYLGDVLDTYWLFFTCHPVGGGATEIRALELTDDACPSSLLCPVDMDAESSVVLTRELAGTEGAVAQPEPILAFDDDDEPVFRLWFVSRWRAAGAAAVGLAVGRLEDGVPQFTAYQANPVLATDDDVLDCAGCDIGGLAVTVDPDNLLRFVVARIVDDEGGTRRDLLPLRQRWPVLP